MGAFRRAFSPGPDVTLNPAALGARMSAWIDRQRWPFNYLYVVALALSLALMAVAAAGITAPHHPTWWTIGMAVGGVTACAQAMWRLRVRGSLLLLDVQEVRTQQRENVASVSRPTMHAAAGVAFVVAVVVGQSRGLSAVFSAFGGFLVLATTIRAVAVYRHRAELKALTEQLQAQSPRLPNA